MDYYLRRCPAFHAVRRAMQPVSVVVAEEGDAIVVFGVNDTAVPVAAELRYGVFTTDGRYPLDRAEVVALAPNASTRLAASHGVNRRLPASSGWATHAPSLQGKGVWQIEGTAKTTS